ncbi:hypothetical protein BDM02DRAFT_3268903 [Thelephora ganbajun]|uniref:Uncharacterized protein n=1 Tax=Thelephora ganbajun TaxID=370292 RepID=A0ACB6ZJ77_THEGA|nr:hypothetical protein BDM02DRAFT_3268903 [Thelephora ganbajun]
MVSPYDIATFLNNCVDVRHDVLDRPSGSAATRDSHWYGRLKFIVYDKTTVDGIDRAAPVKPGLVGGLGLEPGKRVAWKSAGLPYKTGATSARAHRDTSPLLLKGFLHRDIGIGNVLMLDPPVTTKSFESETPGVEQLMAQPTLEDDDQRRAHEDELARHAELLAQTIKEMGPLDKCHGFVIDSNMAARLEDCFTSPETEVRYGTYEFTSTNLLDTMWSSDPDLHSPIDDLKSFYYTTQWAAAFNDGASGEKYVGNKIERFRKMIAGSAYEWEWAKALVQNVHPTSARVVEEYGPFFAQSLVILRPWSTNFGSLGADWEEAIDQTEALDDRDKEKHLAWNFLIFAYRGVKEYFQLLHRHRTSLQGAV